MAKSRYVFRNTKLTVGAIDIHPFITNMTQPQFQHRAA